MSETMLTAVSFFTGIAGIDLALSLAGFDILAQVEINPFCQKVIRKHAPTYWKNAALYGDIRHCGYGRTHTIPYADLFAGGFPCQSVSNAGKREGIAEGTASGLWFEFRRLIGEVRPRAVFLENVEAIIHQGRGGTGVIADLAALGYVGQWGIISAADAAAPHERDRWWCVGYASSVRRQPPGDVKELQGYKERHNSTRWGERRNEFSPTVSAGEILVNANGEHCEERYVPTECDEMGQSGGGHYAPGRQQLARRRILKSRLGRYVDGVSGRMDRPEDHQFPAPPGPQFDYEPPRTTRERSAEELAAYGNAVLVQDVYPIAKLLYEVLS